MDLFFLNIRWLDIVDILLVAWILYKLYDLIKGSAALNIFLGIASIYLFYLITDALKMKMLSKLLGQFTGVGVIALIIVFQQELRRFLILIGKTGFNTQKQWLRRMLGLEGTESKRLNLKIDEIIAATLRMQKDKLGALIVMSENQELKPLISSGIKLNADVSDELIESIFFKNSPLHDGALVIIKSKIVAAKVILPLTDRQDLPLTFGLRHRAAIGVTENFDVAALVLSEQNGKISLVIKGEVEQDITPEKLKKRLREYMTK